MRRSAAEQHRTDHAGNRHVGPLFGGKRLDRGREVHAFGDVAKLLQYLLGDSPRARSSPTLAIPPALLARADEVTE